MSKFKPSFENRESPVKRTSQTSVLQPGSTGLTGLAENPPNQATDVADTNPDPPSLAGRIAFNCTLVFLFLRFSFIHEFISEKLAFDPHLVVIFGGLAFLTALMSGGLGRAFRKRSTWMWCGFAAWMVLASTTSTWRGGSLALTFSYLRTAFPIVLLIPAVATSKEDLRKVVNVIGLAGIMVVAIGFTLGNTDQGRLELETGSTSTIGNSNDLAAHLVFVIPAMAYLLFARERLFLIKLLGAPIIAAAIYSILHTGSRGGLIGIIAGLIPVIIGGSSRVRASVLIGVPVLCICAVPFIPSQTLERLEYLFISDPHGPDESRLQRQALFWASVNITLSHPLVGVGPGRFEEFQAGMASLQGGRGMWHETHNAYTQVSSECGIPALLFLLVAIAITVKALRKTKRSDDPILNSIASTFLVMLAGYGTCIIFLSQAYQFNLLAVTGISNALTDAQESDRQPRG